MNRREALAWTLALLFGGAVLLLCFTARRYELHTWQGLPIRLDRVTGNAWIYAPDASGHKWERISEPREVRTAEPHEIEFQPLP
jgi:hypothetical protein